MDGTVGVAFGGGGARGIAHIGVLRALRARAEYLPTLVAGTSAGSIVAAAYAAGVEQRTMEAAVRDFDWFRKVIDFSETFRSLLHNRHGGLVSNAKLEATVNVLTDKASFSDLPMELAVVATEIEKNRRVVFVSPESSRILDPAVLEGFLPALTDERPGCETLVISDFENVGRAVAASCAIPGLFQPVEIRGMLLGDGAVVDQVPVDVVRAMGADLTIGVSLSFSVTPERVNTAIGAISGMISMLGAQQIRRSLDLADIGFQVPGIDNRSIFDTHQYDLIGEGERAMRAALDRYEGSRSGAFRRALHRLTE